MKKLISMLAAACIFMTCAGSVPAAAADKAYTFKGVNIVKNASLEDITDAKLTDDITVTTGGPSNWKTVAVTDAAHNDECGFYPIGGGFTPTGSYIFMMTGNTNKGTEFTLKLPKIAAGSEVTMTFAKPIVTNNGGTIRNQNDPYAYFKIGDRYISINGGDFDTWREASVVTGADTDEIVFCCDEWGAAAIQKIEVKENAKAALHKLNVKTTQFANLTVNGIRMCANAQGVLDDTPSFAEGEEITIKAQKDGYADAEQTVTVGREDVSVEIYPEMEENAVYYESDFGNTAGKLTLESYDLDLEAKPVTRFFGEVTFTEGGTLTLEGDTGAVVTIEKKADGIYAGSFLITEKDNMQFELFLDKESGRATIWQNDQMYNIVPELTDFTKLTRITGTNATMDCLGVSYPDKSKITIEGPDVVTPYGFGIFEYTVVPEYCKPGGTITMTVENNKSVHSITWSSENGYEYSQSWTISSESGKHTPLLIYPIGVDADAQDGTARIKVEYDGAAAYKDITVDADPKMAEIDRTGNTLNLHGRTKFTIDRATDEHGNQMPYNPMAEDIRSCLKDFKSSDESVITIDDNGMMTAVGVGKATISANLYTGTNNPVSAEYTVENYTIEGSTGADGTAYEVNDLTNDEHITGYKLICGGEGSYIEPTEIPAATAKADGYAVTAVYSPEGALGYSKIKAVTAGDKIEISSGKKKVYFYDGKAFEQITEADTTTEGFEIKGAADAYYTVSPVYKFTDIGDVKDEGRTLDALFAPGYYDVTFKKVEPKRGDILVNGAMVGNNVDQADADRRVTDGALYTAERLMINNGEINVSMTDGSTMLDYVMVERSAGTGNRIFVIGDSLACIYYGDFDREVGGGRAGWGQQLHDFVNLPVTDLANSGQYAKGLYDTAFPGIMKYGKSGDIVLIECAYNDRNYSTREEMTQSVKSMVTQCREKGMIPILVTPNASKHDYKPSVAWSSYLKDVAIDMDCPLIDLSKESYDFLYSVYGDDEDDVVTKNYNLTEVGGDTLHSSYAGAYVWAAIVAKGMEDLVYYAYVNHDFSYSFTDTLGNKITASADGITVNGN